MLEISRRHLLRTAAALSALAAVPATSLLAQAEDFAALRGHWPVFLLDDLASELDREHQGRLLERLDGSGAQVFVTGTDPIPALLQADGPLAVFHVEHGVVRPA